MVKPSGAAFIPGRTSVCILRDELLGFGGPLQRGRGRRSIGDHARDFVEVSGSDFALMARCRIAVRFASKLALLTIFIRAHAAFVEVARKFKHTVVERVKTG